MIHVYDYVFQDASFFTKYVIPEFGIKLPFIKQKVSWIMFITLFLFIFFIATAYLFPEFYDAKIGIENWVTYEKASRSLPIGITLFCFIVAGGITSQFAAKKIQDKTREWLSLNVKNQEEWNNDDRQFISRWLGLNYKSIETD